MTTFDFTSFWNNIFFGFYEFSSMIDFVSDNDARYFYLKKNFEMANNEDINSLSEKHRNMMENYFRDEINRSVYRLKNQMIVFMATVLETIIEEFFICLFTIDPKRIKYCFSISEEAKTMLGFSFDEFIGNQTKEEYLIILSKRAAAICINGKYSNIINRIEKLTGLCFDKNLVSFLDNMYEKRNRIVHENKKFEIDIEYLITIENYIEDFLKIIATKLKCFWQAKFQAVRNLIFRAPLSH